MKKQKFVIELFRMIDFYSILSSLSCYKISILSKKRYHFPVFGFSANNINSQLIDIPVAQLIAFSANIRKNLYSIEII